MYFNIPKFNTLVFPDLWRFSKISIVIILFFVNFKELKVKQTLFLKNRNWIKFRNWNSCQKLILLTKIHNSFSSLELLKILISL